MSKLGDEPAYPIIDSAGAEYYGLTKRELFAAMAMQGFCANSDIDGGIGFDALVSYCVRNADALLAELAKKSEHD